VRRTVLIAGLALALAAPRPAAAAEPLSWETGEGKSYVIPALEIGGFLTGLNQVNRHLIDSKEYGSDGHSIWRNLREPLVIDRDPFSINQLGHPYQGNIYFGFARSAGLDFWRSLAYSLGGSVLWEIAGETSPPALAMASSPRTSTRAAPPRSATWACTGSSSSRRSSTRRRR